MADPGALRPVGLAAIAFLAALPMQSPAAAIEVVWYTIDGGGGRSTDGAGLELFGTIGQADASTTPLAGGGLEIAGGFWPVVADDSGGPCFGDISGDGEIGLADLGALLAHFDTPSGATLEDGDLDGDGDVDLSDLAALLSVYDTPCP